MNLRSILQKSATRRVSAEAQEAPADGASPDRARAARQAFYSGDVNRALSVAVSAGERWIAGA